MINFDSVSIDIPFSVPIDISSDEIIKGLFIPIIASVIGGIRLNLSAREKNQYINLLKMNFPHIEAFLSTIKWYKIVSHICWPYILILGFALGFLIEMLQYNVSTYLQTISISPYISTLDSHILFELFFSLNPSCFIILITYIYWRKLIKSKHLLTTNFTEFCRFRGSQIMVYLSYWFFVGMIFGLGVGVLISFPLILYVFISWGTLFWPILSVMLLSLYFLTFVAYIIDLSKKIIRFSKDVIKPITNYHQCNFPRAKMKTESEEVKGRLRDIQNNFSITLSEKNVLNIIPWDKIRIMEISNANKNEYVVFDNSSINNK